LEYVKSIAEKYKNNTDILILCIGGNQLNKFYDENIVHIHFVEDHGIMAGYYSVSDLLLFLSIAESLGLVLIEAMPRGTPIVSFDVGDNPRDHQTQDRWLYSQNRRCRRIKKRHRIYFSLNDNEIIKIREDMVKLVGDKFNKEIIAEQHLKLYL
jgi:glycosyltransferase involved in cell wall biosynthesis